MFEGRSVAVVIPAHNEEAHVGDVITTVPDFVDRIYAIDDASEDGTWEAIRSAAERINRQGQSTPRRVVPVRHEENRGAGGAVLTGYRQAFADGMEVVAVMDGDGQMDPDALGRIVAPVANGEVDYAKGNRLHTRDDRAMMSGWRLFGNTMLTFLTRVASGYWEMADPQNGYTAISREMLAELPIDRLYTDYGFLNDVLVHLNLNRADIGDVAHQGIYGAESSGIRYRRFVPGLSVLLARRFVGRLRRMYLVRQFHPLVACYGLGTVAIVVGVAGMAASVTGAIGARLIGWMASFSVTLLGATLLSLGMGYDVSENRNLVTRYGRREPAGPAASAGDSLAGVELASDGGERPPEDVGPSAEGE